MSRKSALAVLVAGCALLPTAAWAASDADCAARWNSADGNRDGVLAGPEAERYLAYYRVRARTTPVDGRITRQDFMTACKSDVFMAKAPEPGAPLKGANSFTEGQAKDRIVAAGFTSVSSLAKDGDGVWRGDAMKDGKSAKVAVDFRGNVVSQ
jgi:putative membrane protein